MYLRHLSVGIWAICRVQPFVLSTQIRIHNTV